MNKLAHTHESGADCLACSHSALSELVDFYGMQHHREALDRIEAALSERDELRDNLLDAYTVIDSLRAGTKPMPLDELCRKLDESGARLKPRPGAIERLQEGIETERSAISERKHLDEARFVLWLMLDPDSEHPLQPSNWRAVYWLKAEIEFQAERARKGTKA